MSNKNNIRVHYHEELKHLISETTELWLKRKLSAIETEYSLLMDENKRLKEMQKKHVHNLRKLNARVFTRNRQRDALKFGMKVMIGTQTFLVERN